MRYSAHEPDRHRDGRQADRRRPFRWSRRQLRRDTVNLDPSRSAKVGLKVTPWKRSRSAGEAALAFNVAATDLAARRRRFDRWPAGRALPLIPAGFTWRSSRGHYSRAAVQPLYSEAFYAAGWKRTFTNLTQAERKQDEFRAASIPFPEICRAPITRVIDGDGGDIRNCASRRVTAHRKAGSPAKTAVRLRRPSASRRSRAQLRRASDPTNPIFRHRARGTSCRSNLLFPCFPSSRKSRTSCRNNRQLIRVPVTAVHSVFGPNNPEARGALAAATVVFVVIPKSEGPLRRSEPSCFRHHGA